MVNVSSFMSLYNFTPRIMEGNFYFWENNQSCPPELVFKGVIRVVTRLKHSYDNMDLATYIFLKVIYQLSACV